MSVAVDVDWFILFLRLLFIALLYFFLYQVLRVTLRELTSLATATAPPPVPLTARLVLLDPAQSELPPGTSFPLRVRTTVGRHPDSTIVLDEPFLSIDHAELTYEHGGWWLRDLASTNGTFVNAVAVRTMIAIRPGDIVQFGRITLRLVE